MIDGNCCSWPPYSECGSPGYCQTGETECLGCDNNAKWCIPGQGECAPASGPRESCCAYGGSDPVSHPGTCGAHNSACDEKASDCATCNGVFFCECLDGSDCLAGDAGAPIDMLKVKCSKPSGMWPPTAPPDNLHCAKKDAPMAPINGDGESSFCNGGTDCNTPRTGKQCCEDPADADPAKSGCAGKWCPLGVGNGDCAPPSKNVGLLHAYPDTPSVMVSNNLLNEKEMEMSLHYKCGGIDGCGAAGNATVSNGALTINSARASFSKEGLPGRVDVQNGKFIFKDVDVSQIYANTVATMYTAKMPMGPKGNTDVKGVMPQGAWWDSAHLNSTCYTDPYDCVTEPSGDFFAYADAQGCADFDGTVKTDTDHCPGNSQKTDAAAAQNRIRVPEMDLFEANMYGISITSHACTTDENGNFFKCDGDGQAITANKRATLDPKKQVLETASTKKCPQNFPSEVYGPSDECPINTLSKFDIEVVMQPDAFTATLTQGNESVTGHQKVSTTQYLLGDNHSLLATQWFLPGDDALAGAWLTGCDVTDNCQTESKTKKQQWSVGNISQSTNTNSETE